MIDQISSEIRHILFEKAIQKAAGVGADKIIPAGIKRSLDECITVDRVGNTQLIMFYFNIPGQPLTRAVSVICNEGIATCR